jgi:hypothetical protein
MKELLEAYGEELVRYVLAVTPEDDLATIALTQRQNEGIVLLKPYAVRITNEQNPFLRNQMTRGEVVSAMTTDGNSLLTEIRKSCGGAMPKLDGGSDVVYDLLFEMMVDAYPALLLKLELDFNGVRLDWSYLTSLTFKHKKNDQLCAEMLKDEAIKYLFPGVPDPSEIIGNQSKLVEVHSSLSWSDGSGGGFQLCMLPQTLIAAVFRRAILNGDKSLKAVVKQIPTILGEVRQLSKGRAVKVPTIIGLGNVRMSDGVEVEVYGGIVRAATDADKQWNLWQPDSSQEINAVLATTSELKIIHKTAWKQGEVAKPEEMQKKFEAQRPIFEKTHKTNQQNINLSCFCLLLASKDKNLIAAKEMTKTVYNPLAVMTPSSWRRDNVNTYPEATIDADVATGVATWTRAVKEHFPTSVDLGMRRLLGATTARLDPLDSFVDAVICWENAFGTTDGEVTFRVCGAISHILEPTNKAARKLLFDDLASLYTTRSKLVHGGKEPDTKTAYDHREKAIGIGLDIMRKILTTPSLYAATSSSARSKNILLNLTDDTWE